MAKVILVGGHAALLEGLAQTLLGFGHDVSFAANVGEAAAIYLENPPAIAVVSAEAIAAAGFGHSLPLTRGGALIVYGASHDDQLTLPTSLQRSTLAYLVLPLERHRLVALVQSFDNRSRMTGRALPDDASEGMDLRGML